MFKSWLLICCHLDAAVDERSMFNLNIRSGGAISMSGCLYIQYGWNHSGTGCYIFDNTSGQICSYEIKLYCERLLRFSYFVKSKGGGAACHVQGLTARRHVFKLFSIRSSS
jgi:hypothetical protein